MPCQLSALSEYEPPRRPAPPDPGTGLHDPEEILELPLPPPPPEHWPQPDAPEWNEPGPLRDHLGRLLMLVVEALDGRRQPAQLRAVLDPAAYESLATRCRQGAGGRHRLHSLRTCRPSRTAIELCATITVAASEPRVIALAGRLELNQGHWRCKLLRPLHPGQLTTARAHRP